MSTDLVSRELLVGRKGGIHEYLSASRLNLWLRCPLAFKLRYVDHIETPTSPAQFIGHAVHSALELWYRHRQLGLSLDGAELQRRVLGEWGQAVDAEHVRFKSSADEQASQRQTIDLVSAYLAQVPADEPRPLAVEAAIEAPLVDPSTGEDLGIPLVGVIDLILPNQDGATIADFKTAARGGELLEVVNEVQLSSYSYLYRHVSAATEGALEIRSLIKTKVPKIETHRYGPRNEQHLRRLFAVVRAYLDAIDSGRFIFRPSLACSSCEYCHSHCRDWAG